MKNTLKMMVIGPPSCGKTSMAKELAAAYNCQHVSSGDYARSIQTQANFEALAMGDLSPDHLQIVNWVTKKVNEADRIVIDGFPRSIEQFNAFDFKSIDVVVWIDTSVGDCLQRAFGRGRADDQAPIFWKRYLNYMKFTAPLLYELSQSPSISLAHFVDNGHSLEQNVALVKDAINKAIGG